MQNNTPSPENDYILAGVSYLPFVSIFLIFTSGKRNYFIRYHSAHAIIIYTLNLTFLVLYTTIYTLFRNISEFSFTLNILFGLLFSIQMLAGFVYLIYCSLQAYQGQYLVVPLVTKLFYSIFNR